MSNPIKTAADKYGKRFYVRPTGTPEKVRAVWMAYPPDGDDWVDCTDMDDDAFEALINKLSHQ